MAQMGWFERTYNRIKRGKKKIDIPHGLWTKCTNCSEIVYNRVWKITLRSVPNADFTSICGQGKGSRLPWTKIVSSNTIRR